MSDKPTAAADYAPSRAPDEPCPDCGLPWSLGKHCQRAPAGTICGIAGCKKRPLTECFVNGERVAVWCILGDHRWRKTKS